MLVEPRATAVPRRSNALLRRGTFPSKFPSLFRVAKGRRDMKPLFAFAAIVVASALVVPTISQAATVNSVRVSYADLNLASDQGRSVLERRIGFAAFRVCQVEDTRELALAAATNVCRSDAIERARPAYEAAVNAARRGTVTVLDAAALIVSAR
jgi:UrcA family protein